MPVVVNKEELNVQVADELQPYIDHFHKVKIRDDKLQSCSPFREDSHPSFAVNLDNGSWIDSGAVDEHHKGHFIELLSFLRQEMREDTAEYLLSKYGISSKNTDDLHLDFSWMVSVPSIKVFSDDDLLPFAYRSPYLEGRGISEKVQKAFKIGYDKDKKAVAMPWIGKDGQVVNIKFRATESKKFWYAEGGQRVKYHLYGLHWVNKLGCKKVWITESEIDALKLWTHGMPAIACGTANLSTQQRKLLLNSPVEELVIAADNDPAGGKFLKQLIIEFSGIFTLKKVRFEKEWKDIGDIPSEKMREYCDTSDFISISFNLCI